MDNIASPSRKWNENTKTLAKWLFPLINRSGYGLRYKGMPIHCNTKEEIVLFHCNRREYIRQFQKTYLPSFTKTHLEQHIESKSTFYFTGSSGPETLAMIDIDTHNGEGDGPALASFVLESFPGSFCQTSTTGRGFHVFLVLETNGYQASTMNAFLRWLQKWLNRQREIRGFAAEIEVKGHSQHLKPDGFYCGQLAKIPRPANHFELERLIDSPTWNVQEVVLRLKAFERENKGQNNNQNILVFKKHEMSSDKGPKEQELASKKVCAIPDPLKEAPATARRMTAAWRFVREEGRLPTPEELLRFIKDHEYFTSPWEWNEDKRRQDVERIIPKLKQRYDPSKALYNYNRFCSDLQADSKLFKSEDLSVLLSVLDTAIINDPNADGSVPRDRLEAHWPNVARRKHSRRKWHPSRYTAMRKFLISKYVLEMVEESYGGNRAMRYTVGPNHPKYSDTKRIRIYHLSPELLDDGYILDHLSQEAA